MRWKIEKAEEKQLGDEHPPRLLWARLPFLSPLLSHLHAHAAGKEGRKKVSGAHA